MAETSYYDAVSPTADELDQVRQWMTGKFAQASEPLFSFRYAGRPSSQFLGGWRREYASEEVDEHLTRHTLTYTDPATGLIVRCVGVAWKLYPTVEWTVYLKNGGAADTPLIESLQAMDTAFERAEGNGEFVLHHHLGDRCTQDSFAPASMPLGQHTTLRFAPCGGRPSNGA